MLNPYLEFEYWLNDVAGEGTGDTVTAGGAAVVTGARGVVERGGGVLLKVPGWTHPATRSAIMIHVRNNAGKRYEGMVFPFIQTSDFPFNLDHDIFFLRGMFLISFRGAGYRPFRSAPVLCKCVIAAILYYCFDRFPIQDSEKEEFFPAGGYCC